MRETYTKQNINNNNLTHMVNRNSKSIIIDNDIPILNRASINSRNYYQQPLRENLNVGNQMIKSSVYFTKNNNDQQLFTDPVLMEIVRTDLKRIQSKPKVTFIYPE